MRRHYPEKSSATFESDHEFTTINDDDGERVVQEKDAFLRANYFGDSRVCVPCTGHRL